MSYLKDVREATVRDLIRQIEIGDICLPDFQRDFVWSPTQMALLLESVIRQYPIGTFLFLGAANNSSLGRRSFFGSDTPVPNASSYVIDGQQRLKTFVTLLRTPLAPEAHEPIEYEDRLFKVYLRIDTDLQALPEEVDAPSFVVDRLTESGDKDDYEWQRQHRLIPVEFLLNEALIATWARLALTTYKEESRQRLVKRLCVIGRRLSDYECPIEELEGRLKPQDHANMFRLLNEAGTDLTTFDLLVARLSPKGIKLRQLWQDARDTYKAIDEFDLDPVQLLKVHSLIAQCRAGEESPTCRKRDLREMLENYEHCTSRAQLAREFESEWKQACHYTEMAVGKLRHDFGVVRKKYMPYTPMLVTLAVTLWWLREVRGYRQKAFARMMRRVTRWYWGAIFYQDYQARSDNVISAHFTCLRKWLRPGAKKTPSEINYRFSKHELLEDIDGIESGGDARYKAILCLPLTSGAPRDIFSEEYLPEGVLHDHHIYPDAHLREEGFDSEWRNYVVNRMLITDKTNQEIKRRPPHEYLAGCSPQMLRRHLLPPEVAKPDLDYRGFLNLREELIVQRLWQLLH